LETRRAGEAKGRAEQRRHAAAGGRGGCGGGGQALGRAVAHARAAATPARTGPAGDGPGARYTNTPDGERYLCPDSGDYVGGLVVVNAER
jgi:hypothetical protein